MPQNIEKLLSDHRITNPNDSQLIRAVGIASSEPDLAVAEIVQRVDLQHQNDRVLAMALIDAARLGERTSTNSAPIKTSSAVKIAAAAILIGAIGVCVFAIDRNAQFARQKVELEQSRETISNLETKLTTNTQDVLRLSGEITKAVNDARTAATQANSAADMNRASANAYSHSLDQIVVLERELKSSSSSSTTASPASGPQQKQ